MLLTGRRCFAAGAAAMAAAALLLSGGPMLIRAERVPARGEEKRVELPQGYGLSAKHAGDAGIEKDLDVVFAEGFEAKSVSVLKPRWNEVKAAEIMSFSRDVAARSTGKQSLLMTHVGGRGEGGHLYKSFPKGLDRLYLRFYVKFDADCGPIHHFVHLGGYNPPTAWPQGGAGVRPAGNERFSTGVEPHGDAWRWDYYTYWMEMRGSPPRGQTWGNTFIAEPKPQVRRGEWTCVELMMEMNDVGDSNGEMALWLDGKLISHLGKGFPKGKWIYDKFIPGGGGESVRWNDARGEGENFEVPPGGQPFEGFRWRSTDDLAINFLWLLFYITDAPENHVSKVWFDDVVLAKKYIGPIYRAQPGSRPR